jgi:elongation factor Ts
MEVDMAKVKELRSRTGAGFMTCKKALSETNNDLDAALEKLRKENLSQAAKRAGRSAQQGVVTSYIHPGGRVGVLLELNCETDFVARTDEFEEFARDLAMQVAATSPLAVTREEVPADVVAKEREIYTEQGRNEGKPAEIAAKIAEGRLKKFFEERVLLEQTYVRDLDKPKKRTIQEFLQEKIALMGENVVIRRFSRFELGGE